MIIFSDPHLGLKRKSHTTVESRKALEDTIFHTARDIVVSNNQSKVCVGDLFDSFSNLEKVIEQGAEIVSGCEVVVAGNHDMINRSDVIGSLDLIAMSSGNVVLSDVGQVVASGVGVEDGLVIVVPHHSSQELFEQALEKAMILGIRQLNPVPLFLHCNYDNDMTIGSDTALNLTSEDADILLETFSHIFIGHEHNPRTEKKGRVVIVGNPFPTSFSDISDKYYWELSDSNELTKHSTFKKSEGYKEVKYLGQAAEKFTAQFIDVTGVVEAEDNVKLAKYIKDLWKLNGQALMIRNNTETRHKRLDVARKVDMNNLKTVIKDAIRDKDMKALWEKYLGEIDD